MLRATNGLAGSKLIPTSEDNIKGIGGGNIIDKVSIVSKASMRASEFETEFLISGVRVNIGKLRQAFIIAPTLYYYDLKCHIWIKTDVSSYTIGLGLSQLTLDSSSRWYQITFFTRKMISAQT